MKAEQHLRLSRVGPDTDGGGLLRHGWQPVALLDDLQAQGVPHPVRPVRVLGQELLLFRDALGRPGLIDRACPHRGADLLLGDNEGDGLRCALHGWKFDIDGHCLDMPGEPAGSPVCKRMRQRAYPLVPRAGLLLAWLGPVGGTPDALPPLDCLEAPGSHAVSFRTQWQCHWLQAMELSLDPLAAQAHAAVELRVDTPAAGLLRWTALRHVDETRLHVRMAQALSPNIAVTPLSQSLTLTRWFVPQDDTHTAVYSIVSSYEAPLDAGTLPEDALGLREQRLAESMGPLQDRSREHAVASDKAILAWRRLLLKQMDALRFGDRLPSAADALQAAAAGGLDSIECLVPARDWLRHCRQAVAARRESAVWHPARDTASA
jgi:nitrite reductase/ring-hydroxylating ferredoxin subunit